MAKFIIEVDDDIIRKKAGLDRPKENIDKAVDKGTAFRELYESFISWNILKKLGEGVTEFHITRDMMDSDYRRVFFDRNVSDILALALMADKE